MEDLRDEGVIPKTFMDVVWLLCSHFGVYRPKPKNLKQKLSVLGLVRTNSPRDPFDAKYARQFEDLYSAIPPSAPRSRGGTHPRSHDSYYKAIREHSER